MSRPVGSGKFISKTNLFLDIERETKEKIRALAHSMNKDMSTIVREWIEEKVARH